MIYRRHEMLYPDSTMRRKEITLSFVAFGLFMVARLVLIFGSALLADLRR
jgi:hypothetical protein